MVTLLMSLAVSACSAFADPGKSLPFHLVDNAIVVPVMVSGKGPFRFLLDTGSSRTVVGPALIGRVQPASVARTRMMTPVGHVIRPVVDLNVSLGDDAPGKVAATVVSRAELVASGVTVDGIIGQDVLSSRVYTIDYVRRRIFWDAGAQCHSGERLPLELIDGVALLTVAQPQDHVEPMRLIADTGSDGLVLFERRGRRLPDLTPMDVALLRTVSGSQLARRVRLERFHVGSIVLREQPAMVLTDHHRGEFVADGLLPLHLFSRVTVNGPERYLVVER
jgi:predicted aspartyl protease